MPGSLLSVKSILNYYTVCVLFDEMVAVRSNVKHNCVESFRLD